MASQSARVAVTGLGAVSSLGHGVEQMWQGLVQGRCGIRPLTRIKAEQHRIRHAGEVPALAASSSAPWLRSIADSPSSSVAVQFALEACSEALHQADLRDCKSVALVLGSNFGAMSSAEALFSGRYRLAGQIYGPAEARTGNAVLSCEAIEAQSSMEEVLPEGVTGIVARKLSLGGPRLTLSLSCASGNATIGLAADLIRSGQVQAVVACGYDAISEVVWAGLAALRAMTSEALRPFDKRRDGTIFGEGAGALVLESESHMRSRGAKPLAEFLGYGTSSNAFHMTHPDTDGAGMVRAMAAALRDAGIAPDAVDHINAHATGTPSNDKLETLAIKSVFGQRAASIPVNGIKSMLGHAMGAASSLEAIACIMTIREGIIPPTIGLEQPDAECDLDYVPGSARRADVYIALNNSAGFGGCNASVLFGRWER